MSQRAPNTQTSLSQQIRRYTERRGEIGVYCPTGLEGLVVMQARTKTPLSGTLYEPVVCLILQGAKEIRLGSRTIQCMPGASVIVSHTLPIQSRVTSATASEPYIAMILRLDLKTLRGLIDDVDEAVESGGDGPESIAAAVADPLLLDAMDRLFSLTDDPAGKRVLAPLIEREIHYRLLTAGHGAMLRRLLVRNSHASRIAKAIAHIRDSFTEPLSIPELSSLANMSPSSFHQHFKAVTATSPIQYQKNLRLLEARRLLVDDRRPVTEAAFTVGYQSPAQFSREYSRMFGIPPREDKATASAAS